MELGIAMGVCTGAVRVAGVTEPGLGTEFDMRMGLVWGFGMGIGMVGLLL